MKSLLVILLSYSSLICFGQEIRQTHNYKDSTITCSYNTTAGQLHGKYTSFYPNGKKKAEGQFSHNCRSGLWTVWDTTGRMRIQRTYENPFVYKQIFPALPNDKLIEFINVPQYSLIYNTDGYAEYFKLQERAVHWAKNYWRFLPAEKNPWLFENNRLTKILWKGILNKEIELYSDVEFSKIIQNVDSAFVKAKISGLYIKEVAFFDIERFVSETRIVGICPVVITDKNDTTELGWVYYPSIRKQLAAEKLSDNGFYKGVRSLDDLFFFRYFTGNIIGSTTVMSFVKEPDKAEQREIEIIENEHDIWMGFSQ